MSENNTETTPTEVSEEEAHTNPFLAMPVDPDSELKNYLVSYAGERFEKEEVTVHMIAEILAADFPEFAFAFAEENFLRGYQLGLDDAVRISEKAAEESYL